MTVISSDCEAAAAPEVLGANVQPSGTLPCSAQILCAGDIVIALLCRSAVNSESRVWLYLPFPCLWLFSFKAGNCRGWNSQVLNGFQYGIIPGDSQLYLHLDTAVMELDLFLVSTCTVEQISCGMSTLLVTFLALGEHSCVWGVGWQEV